MEVIKIYISTNETMNNISITNKIRDNMRDNADQLKSGKKIAWLLIVLGLVLGGIAGVNQDPAPQGSSDGWNVPDIGVLDLHPIIVPDQTGDEIADVFYWFNPTYKYDKNYTGLDDSWFEKAGAILVDGYDGSVIKYKLFDDYNQDDTIETPWYATPSWDMWNNDEFLGVYVSDDSIIIAAVPVNISFIQPHENNPILNPYYSDNWHFLKISLTSLFIVDQVNITGEGWEPNGEILQNPNTQYHPKVEYLRDSSYNAPYSSYSGEMLAYENTLRYYNDGFTTFNDSKKVITFIDPFTLEEISNVTWDYSGPIGSGFENYAHYMGFCDGPTLDIEQNWKYPYFYCIIYNQYFLPDTAQLFMTTIDQLSNNQLNINWTISYENLNEIGGFAYYTDIVLDFKCYLSMNSSGEAEGIAVHEIVKSHINNTLQLPEASRQSFKFADGDKIPIIAASSIHCFNFETINSPSLTFKMKSKVDNPSFQNPVVLINNIVDFGVLTKIVPIKTESSSADQSTSLALIFSEFNYQTTMINDEVYPFDKHKVFFLKTNVSGSELNTSEYILNSIGGVEFESTTNLVSDFYHIEYCINYDIDGNNQTDIPFPGTLKDEPGIGSIFEKQLLPVNGPIFIITNGWEQIQYNFWRIFSSHYIFRSDVNGDGVSDALLTTQTMFLVTPDSLVEPNWFAKKMADPNAKVMLFLGSGMLISAVIIILVLFTKMKSTSIKLKVTHKGTIIGLVVLAALLIGVLYYQLGIIIEETQSNLEFEIGLSEELQTLQNLIRTSGWGTFALATLMPLTAGLFMLTAPLVASKVVSLNQLKFTKAAGIKAALKKEAVKEEDVKKLAHSSYRIVLIPPFGRKMAASGYLRRMFSILSLCVAIGLYSFDYVPKLIGLTEITEILSVTDPNFMEYITRLFIYLILPGLIAIPIFFWLIPSSWLLDDAGVLFYIKQHNTRKPEDVESIGGWFSNYIQGFLGISAIISYVVFVINSPITELVTSSGSIGLSVGIFVFGYLVLAGISIAIFAIVMHEMTLPYNMSKLYKILKKNMIPVQRTSIQFHDHEVLDIDTTINSYMEGRMLPSAITVKPEEVVEEPLSVTHPSNEPKPSFDLGDNNSLDSSDASNNSDSTGSSDSSSYDEFNQ